MGCMAEPARHPHCTTAHSPCVHASVVRRPPHVHTGHAAPATPRVRRAPHHCHPQHRCADAEHGRALRAWRLWAGDARGAAASNARRWPRQRGQPQCWRVCLGRAGQGPAWGNGGCAAWWPLPLPPTIAAGIMHPTWLCHAAHHVPACARCAGHAASPARACLPRPPSLPLPLPLSPSSQCKAAPGACTSPLVCTPSYAGPTAGLPMRCRSPQHRRHHHCHSCRHHHNRHRHHHCYQHDCHGRHCRRRQRLRAAWHEVPAAAAAPAAPRPGAARFAPAHVHPPPPRPAQLVRGRRPHSTGRHRRHCHHRSRRRSRHGGPRGRERGRERRGPGRRRGGPRRLRQHWQQCWWRGEQCWHVW